MSSLVQVSIQFQVTIEEKASRSDSSKSFNSSKTYKCNGRCDFGTASGTTNQHGIAVRVHQNGRAHGRDGSAQGHNVIGRRRRQTEFVDFARRRKVVHLVVQDNAGVFQMNVAAPTAATIKRVKMCEIQQCRAMRGLGLLARNQLNRIQIHSSFNLHAVDGARQRDSVTVCRQH